MNSNGNWIESVSLESPSLDIGTIQWWATWISRIYSISLHSKHPFIAFILQVNINFHDISAEIDLTQQPKWLQPNSGFTPCMIHSIGETHHLNTEPKLWTRSPANKLQWNDRDLNHSIEKGFNIGNIFCNSAKRFFRSKNNCFHCLPTERRRPGADSIIIS